MEQTTKRAVIRIEDGVCTGNPCGLHSPFSLSLYDGCQYAIVGRNGAGKSLLVDILRGRRSLQIPQPYYDFGSDAKEYVADNIQYIAFRDSYGSADRNYYMDQRWNSQEIDPDTPTVGDLLDRAFAASGQPTEERVQLRNQLYDLFQIQPLLDKYVILLSSGELRKFILIKALFKQSKVLIIDNPFIGLDAGSRQLLATLLRTMVSQTGLMLILVLAKAADIPNFITHVVEVREGTVMPTLTRAEYMSAHAPVTTPVLSPAKRQALIDLPPRTTDYHASEVVRLNQVSIRYGTRTILKDLSWVVRNGERWALRGENGAGKSTLLSIVYADNPQSYACDIALFGRQRGSGESIWEIKKHIGYVSPEMHRAYQRDMAAIRIVASGLKDSIGLYTAPKESEYDQCRWWMGLFGIGSLAERSFMSLSSGQQRLVLLARAFVKDPELLILDEPLHGLDEQNSQMVKEIINAFCLRSNKTLIMVTHYDDELPACITDTLVLRRNR